MKHYINITVLFILISVGCSTPNPEPFLAESMRTIIEERGKQWDLALKQQDASIILNLYDDNAHYLVDGRNTIHGNINIAHFWEKSFGEFKGLKLNMESLEGTEELLYETGNGVAQFDYGSDNKFDFQFKYVNVWKRQSNGEYKVVIDMFNDVKKD